MNTKLVSSIGDVARSRLVIVGVDALLMDIATLLADTQVSLVVVCGPDGAMAGVITKTNIVRLIGGCCGDACRTRAADVMTQEVTSCHPTDCLPDVLSMMQQRTSRSSTRITSR
ncbi:CBS domain-containing protein [Aromatoleum buckelii]|uniref:CBS domain-containing protein n=1 Tax=Aromatoleum buckelii TaxID=200254 RepID=UPI001B7CEED8|nr:CBS domain-containing protein [Aromatoleum buckelii]MCK0509639.1 CBS domain-containing protein [Aromatoleum buckelii]